MMDMPNDAGAALLQLIETVRATGYSFVTVTPETHRRVNARSGRPWSNDVADVLGWSRPFREGALPLAIERSLTDAAALLPYEEGWLSRVRMSSLAGMLFLHSSFPTDTADAVFFGPDTYRFAQAVEAHLRMHPAGVRRCVDIGCGTGAGGILVGRHLPEAEIVLVDINPEALRLARANARAAGVNNVRLYRSDLLDQVDGQFDLIIANPPYLVDPAARAYRHGGGPLGAGLSLRIVETAIRRLAPGGTLLLYTGAAIVAGTDPFRAAACERLETAGLRWSYREVDPDVFGEELDREAYREADRIAAVVLIATNGD